MQVTVEGPNGTTITGTPTEVSTGGRIETIESGGHTYERCPYTGKYFG